MIKIEHNISLKKYNTFGIDVKADHYVSVTTVGELDQVYALSGYPEKFILGGGSNMLLTRDIKALVVHINIRGKEIIHRDDTTALVKVYAGENWHEFVLWTLSENLGGLENLSLIPGNVGSSPIQNIGAYGVELKDHFAGCEVYEIGSGVIKHFTPEECQFGYRDSIFKNSAKGKYIITSVSFRLTAENHTLHTSYGAIDSELQREGISNPTVKDVSNAVISIRQSKLPNPAQLGNSGSFFKNPVLSLSDFEQFHYQFPEAPFYVVSDTERKVPAGWLIENCGLKGYRKGDAGVHKKQALVLVNYGHATGSEIWELALYVQEKVKNVFGIEIEPEVNVF